MEDSFYRNFFPCAGGVALFLIPFVFFAFLRYLRYKETLALAEKGLARPEQVRGNGKDTLRWGIAITAIGLALCVGLYPLGASRSVYPLGFGPWMLIGLLPTFFGLALVLIYVLTREKKPEDKSSEATGTTSSSTGNEGADK
ncbi:MAG TPA: DUF6249 domain-containing protein [Anaerolineae bacterium]